jgi:hypothetical protein
VTLDVQTFDGGVGQLQCRREGPLTARGTPVTVTAPARAGGAAGAARLT